MTLLVSTTEDKKEIGRCKVCKYWPSGIERDHQKRAGIYPEGFWICNKYGIATPRSGNWGCWHWRKRILIKNKRGEAI